MNLPETKIDSKMNPQSGYIIPFDFNEIVITQGYNGPNSHFPIKKGLGNIVYDDRFCIDFGVPYETPVLAAKDGEVYGMVNSSIESYGGLELTTGIKSHPNFIILEHEDGFFTLYSHLIKESAEVKIGNTVKKGEVIARTGKSGWIGPTPHLHFAVFKNTKGTQTFPVVFENYNGLLEHSEIKLNKK